MSEPSLTSQLEAEALKNPIMQGGNGYAAATLRDQGYIEEATKGAIGSSEPIVKKNRTRKKR